MNNSINTNNSHQENFVHNISFFTEQPVMVDATPVQKPVMPKQTPKPQEKPPEKILLTQEQMNMLVEQCKPQTMSNPVKVTEPSYLITEQQMIYLLSMAQGNPQTNLMPQKQQHVQGTPQHQQIVIGNTQQQPKTNAVDTFCNATLGTAGRIAHAFTGVVDSVVDVLTLGYGAKKR